MVLLTLFLTSAAPVRASFLGDIFDSLKQLLIPNVTPAKLTVDSAITQAADEDENHNGQVDAGEIVTFSYTITNPTKNEYAFSTLNTNIPRDNLNFIHDIKGTSSLSDADKTITIPNLRINPQSELIISFKARTNYSSDELILSTEPELLTQDKQSLLKSGRKTIQAKPLKDNEIPNMIKLKTQEPWKNYSFHY